MSLSFAWFDLYLAWVGREKLREEESHAPIELLLMLPAQEILRRRKPAVLARARVRLDAYRIVHAWILLIQPGLLRVRWPEHLVFTSAAEEALWSRQLARELRRA